MTKQYPRDMTPPYTVLPSPGEGLGCFANTTILAGTCILIEKPLFAVQEPRSNAVVLAGFSRLTISQQEQYLNLHAADAQTQGSARVVNIFNSNAWQTSDRTSILPLGARFNHSCIPNASFAWNPRLSCITVYAIVDILAKSQIYLCYEKPYQTRSERRTKLSAYGFVCSCPACDSDFEASEIRRARMIVLDGRIRVGRRQKWKAEEPKAALELLRLLKEEGLMGEALGLAYHDAAVGWRRNGRLDMAIRYALKELQVCITCYGIDSPYVDTTRQLLQELKLESAKLTILDLPT